MKTGKEIENATKKTNLVNVTVPVTWNQNELGTNEVYNIFGSAQQISCVTSVANKKTCLAEPNIWIFTPQLSI